jgi:hypothetical protein
MYDGNADSSNGILKGFYDLDTNGIFIVIWITLDYIWLTLDGLMIILLSTVDT